MDAAKRAGSDDMASNEPGPSIADSAGQTRVVETRRWLALTSLLRAFLRQAPSVPVTIHRCTWRALGSTSLSGVTPTCVDES